MFRSHACVRCWIVAVAAPILRRCPTDSQKEANLGDYLRLWGKSGVSRAHPLLRHMLDSGMVAKALLRAPQMRRIRALLIRLGGLDASTVDQAVPEVPTRVGMDRSASRIRRPTALAPWRPTPACAETATSSQSSVRSTMQSTSCSG